MTQHISPQDIRDSIEPFKVIHVGAYKDKKYITYNFVTKTFTVRRIEDNLMKQFTDEVKAAAYYNTL